MLTYNEALDIIGSSKNLSRCIAHRTKLIINREDLNKPISVVYWRTPVVIIHSDNNLYTLNSNGYYTRTTKKRINEYSPIFLYQVKEKWVVASPKGDKPFVDGMKVDIQGNVVSYPETDLRLLYE